MIVLPETQSVPPPVSLALWIQGELATHVKNLQALALGLVVFAPPPPGVRGLGQRTISHSEKINHRSPFPGASVNDPMIGRQGVRGGDGGEGGQAVSPVSKRETRTSWVVKQRCCRRRYSSVSISRIRDSTRRSANTSSSPGPRG